MLHKMGTIIICLNPIREHKTHERPQAARLPPCDKRSLSVADLTGVCAAKAAPASKEFSWRGKPLGFTLVLALSRQKSAKICALSG
jgi:hypothetical protein